MSYYEKIIRLMELRVAVHLDTILKLMDGRVAVLYEYLDKNIKLEKDQIPLILNKLKEKLDIYEKEFKIDEDDILEKNLNFLQNTLSLTNTQVNIIRMGAVVLNYNSYILDQMTSSYKSKPNPIDAIVLPTLPSIFNFRRQPTTPRGPSNF